MTAPNRFSRQLLARITNMRTHIDSALTHLGTRDPQKLAELCIFPTDLGTWMHWVTWLVFTLLE